MGKGQTDLKRKYCQSQKPYLEGSAPFPFFLFNLLTWRRRRVKGEKEAESLLCAGSSLPDAAPLAEYVSDPRPFGRAQAATVFL